MGVVVIVCVSEWVWLCEWVWVGVGIIVWVRRGVSGCNCVGEDGSEWVGKP